MVGTMAEAPVANTAACNNARRICGTAPVFEARNLSYLEPTNVFVSTILEQKILPAIT